MKTALKMLLETYEHPFGEVSILLTDRKGIQQMNRDFRSIDAPTDVLTFVSAPNPAQILGDIAIAVDVAESQAAVRGIPLAHEMIYLILHGGLHLVGLDDETETERAEMMRAMNELAVRLGIPKDQSWHTIKEVAHG